MWVGLCPGKTDLCFMGIKYMLSYVHKIRASASCTYNAGKDMSPIIIASASRACNVGRAMSIKL